MSLIIFLADYSSAKCQQILSFIYREIQTKNIILGRTNSRSRFFYIFLQYLAIFDEISKFLCAFSALQLGRNTLQIIKNEGETLFNLHSNHYIIPWNLLKPKIFFAYSMPANADRLRSKASKTSGKCSLR